MNAVLNAGIVVGAFLTMELVAWFTHKYVMHRFLWSLHQDHHVADDGFFEKNDGFFLLFAVPSFLLCYYGSLGGFDYRFWIGIGILLYGMVYFLVHDVFIHQRFKIFRKTDNTYLRALRKAHKVHHKHLVAENGECFGMLLFPLKYLKEAAKNSKSD
ncbi:MAG: beta-carotene hydroxylase [Cyclobacteriaceae bacterium]|nr:MAG: beta-carotene hydroxylase [Cyclobacteriaceae bacterium]